MVNLSKILIVDDEQRSLEALTRTLDEDFEVLAAVNATDAYKILEEQEVKVILCDNRMPGTSGVEFLTQVRIKWPKAIRLLISAYSDVEDIIDGINDGGIYQFIAKPWHPNNLIVIIKNVVKLYNLQLDNKLLAAETRLTTEVVQMHNLKTQKKLIDNFHIDSIFRSKNSPLNFACDQLMKVAPYDISVLITGESGTGKEMFARALHYNSGRSKKPFVAENCAALSDEFLISELFGHKKGSFTGAVSEHIGLLEQANGGTVFLDEIGDVTKSFQVKLLRVLQEGEMRPLGSNQSQKVDIRIVAATNLNLEEEVKAGRFRADLYFRLATVSIDLTPLRERREDIEIIAEKVLEKAITTFGKKIKGFTAETLGLFKAFDWPGNVRELQNEVQRSLVLCSGDWIEPSDLSPKFHPMLKATASEKFSTLQGSLSEQVQAFEQKIIQAAMARNKNNKTKVADELGLSRVGLRSKLDRF
ncbi:MAG: sigma-54 dependent transcriptional regulator [SAR324 cluster bacterium]|nr:sigma-54 dependent transcriptional regulator [SAR324 cluster bacterium]